MSSWYKEQPLSRGTTEDWSGLWSFLDSFLYFDWLHWPSAE